MYADIILSTYFIKEMVSTVDSSMCIKYVYGERSFSPRLILMMSISLYTSVPLLYDMLPT